VQALKQNPNARLASLTFTIDPNGAVNDAHADATEPALGECVVTVLRSLAFQPREGGAPITVTYPLTQ
jgi:hypothetical protein